MTAYRNTVVNIMNISYRTGLRTEERPSKTAELFHDGDTVGRAGNTQRSSHGEFIKIYTYVK